MAHFAKLDENNVVEHVIVVSNDVVNNLEFPDSEPIGIEFCQSLFGENTKWKQTSYNSSFRKHYAGIGFKYDETMDAFVPPQPFKSWTLNTETVMWDAPKPMPTDAKAYTWNEESLSWVEATPTA